MAKKQRLMNIKPLVFKGSKDLVEVLGRGVGGLQFTKVIQTYVVESNTLKMAIGKEGKMIFSGTVRWIGNRTDGTRGSVFCVEKATKGEELKLIMPTEDTAQDIALDLDKLTIKINSKETVKCSVCGKPIRIFDEVAPCPLCNSPGHEEHLVDWVKMRKSCPICKKGLDLDQNNRIVPSE